MVRGTLRQLALPAALVFAVAYTLGPDFLTSLAALLHPSGPRGPLLVLALTAILASVVGLTEQRARSAIAGWASSLPAAGSDRRLATVLACALPALVPAAAVWLLGLHPEVRGGISAIAVTGSRVLDAAGFLVAGSAVAAMCSRLRIGWRLLAGLSAAAALVKLPLMLSLAVLGTGLVLTTGLAKSPTAPSSGLRLPRPRGAKQFLLPQMLLRTLGWGALPAVAVAVLPGIAARVFTAHNDLPLGLERGALRLGAAVGATLALSALSERLRERGLPPLWMRSLPQSSRARGVTVATTLAVPAATVAFVPLQPLIKHGLGQTLLAGAWLTVLLAFLALRFTAAIFRQDAGDRGPSSSSPRPRFGSRDDRQTEGGRTGLRLAGAVVTSEGLLVAAWITILPWAVLLLAAAVPWAASRVRHAVQQRRTSHFHTASLMRVA